jgi:hypothetical protein
LAAKDGGKCQAACGEELLAMRAIAQMKPAISRAIAVVTTLWHLPLAASLR